MDGISPTISDQVYSVAAATGIDVREIMTWTVNRFNEILKATDRIMHYKIYRTAEMGGMVTFKNGSPIKTWLRSEDPKEGQMKTVGEARASFGGVLG